MAMATGPLGLDGAKSATSKDVGPHPKRKIEAFRARLRGMPEASSDCVEIPRAETGQTPAGREDLVSCGAAFFGSRTALFRAGPGTRKATHKQQLAKLRYCAHAAQRAIEWPAAIHDGAVRADELEMVFNICNITALNAELEGMGARRAACAPSVPPSM